MAEAVRTAILPFAALAAASAASAASGLLGGEPFLAAGMCAIWTAAGWSRFGLASLPLAMPALALVPGGGWTALVGFALAALAGGVALRVVLAPDPEQLRELRAELRDAEHERSLLHRHIQRYPALLDACLELSAAREIDQFATTLCQRARELLPGVNTVLVFLGSPTEQLCRASSDDAGKSCPQPAGDDERYVATESRPLTRRDGNRVRVLIPLRGDRRQQEGLGEALRGVLVVELVLGDVGDRLALELLGALGRLGGLGLAAVDLVNQARGLALRDDLTGLFGQHEFLRRLDEQVAAARRHATPLGVMMCDMDHLKLYNDRFGHLAGDDALRVVAREMLRVLPTDAIVCRYGGEEFAALLPGRDLERLALIADALRTAIAGVVVDPAHPERQVTASIGVALVHDKEQGRAALTRADAACYRAKAAGRNRIDVARDGASA